MFVHAHLIPCRNSNIQALMIFGWTKKWEFLSLILYSYAMSRCIHMANIHAASFDCICCENAAAAAAADGLGVHIYSGGWISLCEMTTVWKMLQPTPYTHPPHAKCCIIAHSEQHNGIDGLLHSAGNTSGIRIRAQTHAHSEYTRRA